MTPIDHGGITGPPGKHSQAVARDCTVEIDMAIILSCALFAILLCGVLWARNNEKIEWNNGVCADTGLAWKSFDMDSSCARGYT